MASTKTSKKLEQRKKGYELEPAVTPVPSDAARKVDRERLCNDVLNTSVMAALIGGFALNFLQSKYEFSESNVDMAIYVLSVIAVHACTCSALTSAFVYRTVNNLHDDEVAEWAKKYHLIVKMPLMKFSMGCFSYMVTVVLRSFRDLEGFDVWCFFCMGVGLMSMSSVVGVVFVLTGSTSSKTVRKFSEPDSAVPDEHDS